MAKKLAHKYTFDASARQVRIEGNISHDRLLLITNVTDNINIYNFADPTLAISNIEYDAVEEETVVTLAYDTNQMSNTDTLQIFYEKDYVAFEPSETYVDPVSKFRVSTPENLIDTDFEYGPQASKWETLQLINQIPSFFSSTADTTIQFIETVESTQNSEIITVTTGFDHGLTSGTPITVTGLSSITAEGTYLIQSVPSNTTFTYKARAKQLLSTELQGTYTSIIPGEFFQGSQIALDGAAGITSDYFEKIVTVKAVTEVVVGSVVSSTWTIGSIVTSDSGAEGVLTKVTGNTLNLINVVGTFSPGDIVSDTGSSSTYTVSSSQSVGNVYFIDGEQQPNLNLRRNSIYRFNLSDPSVTTHVFNLSITDDGTHGGGAAYTTFVYKVGTEGTNGCYLRIYVTNATPDLYYYCATHPLMGGLGTIISATDTKVILRTVSEHGFSDNTNFYFVNSISPKALDVLDSSANAPDRRPFIDGDETVFIESQTVQSETIPYDYESTYTLRFTEADINYSSDTITIPDHKLSDGYALLYYPAPGDTPIGGLNRMLVYYAEVVNSDTIKLHDSQRLNILKNLSVGGTFNNGTHQLGLVYNVYRETKNYQDWYGYFHTYYREFGGTYSGHDFGNNTAPRNSTFGLGGKAWDIVAAFSVARPGYSGHNFFFYNYEWYERFGTWRTYGYHRQTLPLGTTATSQGSWDFITDDENRGVNPNVYSNASDRRNYGYTMGGYARQNARYYWTSNIWGEYINDNRLRIYGDNNSFWRCQGDCDGWNANRFGYNNSLNRTFNSVTSDGNTNMYFALLTRNTSTNDTFYSLDHRFVTNNQVSITVDSGSDIRFWSDQDGGTGTLTTGSSVFIETVDANRFRIKSSTNSSEYRLREANGVYTFSGTFINPTRNSVYIADNQFSNGELILLTKDVSATIPGGLTDNATYYFRAINNNRFQLLANPGDTNEVDITSSGSGLHTFENASATFGAVDGSYTTTRKVDDFTLEVTLPFKISPGKKPFDAANDVDVVNNYITIAEHFLAPGTKVIYDANGNTPVTGLSDNTDYYVIVLDDSKIQLAASDADAIADPPVPVVMSATGTGTQRLITANLSGLVTGAGTLTITSTSRTIVGNNTQFKRYFKIGDYITLIDSTTTPSGTLYTRRISAIKDDQEMLVDSAPGFTDSNAKYFIPTYIYVRPDGYFLHRPFDGGMEIGTSNSPDGLICRQTRKYFRYQSGKGIQTSFAINFIPQNQIVLLAYEPQGNPGTYTLTGSNGSDIAIVDEGTADININMTVAVDVVGCPAGTGIEEIIDANTIRLSTPLTATLTSESVQFNAAEYSRIRASRPHYVQENTVISITQSDVDQYNGDFAVAEIINDFEFYIIVKDLPNNVSASGGFPQFGVRQWSGSSVRAGMFDFQNGFFFEYDGQTLNCVRRSSVQQLTGKLQVTTNSSVVHGTDTRFTSQVSEGDKIVIRGMTHKVVKVRNDTDLVIQPAYRGVTNFDVIGTKTIDVSTGQPDWNIDICDGTGVSGFLLDINRIQMCYMDYSWYGAGKIRYGFKDQNGHVKYVHEYKHNNRLRESYFRSGNLPARYEIENIGTPSFVPSLFHWGTSVIMDGMFQDDEAYLFTASGNVLKFTNASTQTSASNGTSVILENRISWYNSTYFIRIPFASSEASKLTVNTLLYQASAGNGYFSNGRVIDSRTYLSGSTYFVYIQYLDGSQSVFPRRYAGTIQSAMGGNIASGTTFNIGAPAGSENLIPDYMPLISIRLAPSVDSSITGALGEREIINRMQLALESVGVQVTHDTEVTLVLNAELSTDLYEDVSSPSLCQLVKHTPNETISGGQRILSFRATGGANFTTDTTNYDLSEISSLSNSILGGDGVYPNGPDLLTIIAEVIDSSGVSTSTPYAASSRVTWKESQA
jgi:hypothetical protein